MRRVRVQGRNQGRPILDDPNPRMAMAMNPPLMTLGEAKPSLQVEIVPNRLELTFPDEQARQEADHHRRHLLSNGISRLLKASDQRLELLLAARTTLHSRLKGGGYLRDVLDVVSDRLLLGLDLLQSPVDAAGQAAELLFGESPFSASKLRWIDSRTSCNASAMRRPGGWSGPP